MASLGIEALVADVLIMAGGESKRMRRTGDGRHKALVPVCGLPLIERNLRYVMDAGFRDVVVAVSAREEELATYVQSSAQEIARKMGARCKLLIEASPLGTLGAAGQVQCSGDLLIVNVDNLTALPLEALMEHHRSTGADFTIAAHRHPLPLDFGELAVEDGRVLEYREKPVRYPLVSSGIYVINRKAARFIKPNEALGVPDFFSRLQSNGLNLRAFEHSAAWIDVNDADALRKAEAMFPQ